MFQNLCYMNEEKDDPEYFQATRNNIHYEISIINFRLTQASIQVQEPGQ